MEDHDESSMAAAQDQSTHGEEDTRDSHQSNGDRKRKRFENKGGLKHGRGNKRRDMGRKEYEREQPDRRSRNEAEKAKRDAQGLKPTHLPSGFAQDEIDAEDRRPKRKVAVMIGYSGTGYKGMQISPTEKTIEGDLFTAFVKAGAISKANADDPKKSALVRCARTDKGVHAAANMISLKLIIEDSDIVEKINTHLSPQIRVWGMERTTGSFSCYQSCDSRWYEYLMPSHAFLPPHPSSTLAKKLEEHADEMGDREAYNGRQAEVKDFWAEVEKNEISPILESLDEELRALVNKALYEPEDTDVRAEPDVKSELDVGGSMPKQAADIEETVKFGQSNGSGQPTDQAESAAIIINEPALRKEAPPHDEIQPAGDGTATDSAAIPPTSIDESIEIKEALDGETTNAGLDPEQKDRLFDAIKKLKNTYEAAKRRYRIPKQRIDRIQNALDHYLGTRNFHNYTVAKNFRDPSAKRQIKSFVANSTPILINGTEWLSLKVHGQSFMMHQIRKMVGMVALLVRCGTDLERIPQSYGETKYSIPKAPGLGLLLERPVFDVYNTQVAAKFDREKLDFGKYEKELEDFKQKEIYQKIFAEEERENTFHQFFNHIDNYKEPHFLYLTSKGIAATIRDGPKGGKDNDKLEMDSDDEGAGGEEGG